jgi:hypothetical protein
LPHHDGAAVFRRKIIFIIFPCRISILFVFASANLKIPHCIFSWGAQIIITAHILSFPSRGVLFFSVFVFLYRPLSFSCPQLSCIVLGDCLSKQVVLRGAVFSFSNSAEEYQLVK